jgi:hypothetical protein
MTDIDLKQAARKIWFRAIDPDVDFETLQEGDWQLVSLSTLHGYMMNGGVWHGIGYDKNERDQDELANAKAAYAYFGLSAVVDLLNEAEILRDTGVDIGTMEREMLRRYMALADKDPLYERIAETLRRHPSDFAPLD